MIKHTINNSDLAVYEYNLLSEFDFPTLVNYINEYKEQYPKNHYNNDGVWNGGNWWHSDYLVQYRTDDFNDLISNIEQKATKLVDSGSKMITVNLEIKESWIIDYKITSFHKEHDHNPISFGAICYMDTFCASDIWFSQTKITPETGKLIIFPGTLRHKVSPMTDVNGRRLVMAFNLYPKMNYENHNNFIDNFIK